MSDTKYREKDSTGGNLGKRGYSHYSAKETRNSLGLQLSSGGSKSASFLQNNKRSYHHPFKQSSILNVSGEN